MHDSARTERSSLSITIGAFLLDAVLVLAFAITGRSSHSEGLDLAGVWSTAWPFLLGLTVIWVAALLWRKPLSVLRAGLPAWAGTVVLGMLIRALTGSGTALPFIIVATITLCAFLVGWRAIAALVRTLRRRSRA